MFKGESSIKRKVTSLTYGLGRIADKMLFRVRISRLLHSVDIPKERDFMIIELAKKQADLGDHEGAVWAALRINDHLYKVSVLEHAAGSIFKSGGEKYNSEDKRHLALRIHRMSIKYSHEIDQEPLRVLAKKNIILNMHKEGYSLEVIRDIFWQERVMPLGEQMLQEGMKRPDDETRGVASAAGQISEQIRKILHGNSDDILMN